MAKVPKTLHLQKQMFFVAGHIDQDIEGATSWTFSVLADNGAEACRSVVRDAARYGLRFTMELCVYARGPRIRRGISSYGRIIHV